MVPRPPKQPTRSEMPSREVPRGQRHRGRVDRAKRAGRCPREHARASAAAEMHQPTPSIYRNRRRMRLKDKLRAG
eukprot:7795089-Pyramimonas_sp.AAC.1